MENILMLLASFLCGCCALLYFTPIPPKKLNKVLHILWYLTVALVTFTTVLMITLQVFSRFEYQYVYHHTSRNTALIYKISSLWSGQEGSFLLWAFLLCIMGLFVLKIKGQKSTRVFGIYSSISFCIFLMCIISKPFLKMEITPSDGLGLTQALKDPWMIVHPPLVFIAYSAMAILFSLSITVTKDSNKIINSHILTWLRISWVFLGLGILSGSIWAYRALGWGGYWAWDPIENTALVPWLVLTGYLHNKDYNHRSVCIVPFSIACFGVFLARSGILKDQSAHAYTDGNIIISGIILCLFMGAFLYLISTRIRKVNVTTKKKGFSLHDKRLIIYSINGYAALIFIGTVSPIILKINTPIIYYSAISIAFASIYSILLLVWDLEWLKRRNILMLVVSTIFVMGMIVLSGSIKFWWLLLLWICLMPPSLWLVSGFRTKSLNYYFSHLGMVLLILGTIGSSSLGKEASVITDADSNHIVIYGKEISLTELGAKDMLILTFPTMDIVVQTSKIITLSEGRYFIPYVTKPLIILFWIGGFVILASPGMRALFLRVKIFKHTNHDID